VRAGKPVLKRNTEMRELRRCAHLPPKGSQTEQPVRWSPLHRQYQPVIIMPDMAGAVRRSWLLKFAGCWQLILRQSVRNMMSARHIYAPVGYHALRFSNGDVMKNLGIRCRRPLPGLALTHPSLQPSRKRRGVNGSRCPHCSGAVGLLQSVVPATTQCCTVPPRDRCPTVRPYWAQICAVLELACVRIHVEDTMVRWRRSEPHRYRERAWEASPVAGKASAFSSTRRKGLAFDSRRAQPPSRSSASTMQPAGAASARLHRSSVRFLYGCHRPYHGSSSGTVFDQRRVHGVYALVRKRGVEDEPKVTVPLLEGGAD
jgi:hypothetical protein